MSELFSVLYLLLFLTVGFLLARQTLPSKNGACFALGCAYCVGLLATLPAFFAFFVGFNLVCTLLASLTVSVIGVFSLYKNMSFRFNLSTTKNLPAIFCTAPFVMLTMYLLHTHVLLFKDGAYYTGQSGFGDTAMHLAFIKNIAVQGQMPPQYPLLAGQEVFGYTFLSESISSVFLLFDANLKFATILPCLPATISIFGFIWLLAKQVLKHTGKTVLAFLFFALGGGFGFAYFISDAETFKGIFTNFYTTPTNHISENIRWVNIIADMLVPQRSTLFGYSILFACLYLLYLFAFEGKKQLWLSLGLLASSLPLLHTHSLLALVIISAVYFTHEIYTVFSTNSFLPNFKKAILLWLLYALVAGVICVPQLFGIIFEHTSSGHGFLTPHFNWANEGDNYFWFYIKNLGLVYLLIFPAFFFAKQTLRRWYCAALVLLAISEFVLFQPNPYDNIKLLFVWFLYSCILVANALWDWLAKMQNRKVAVIIGAVCIVLCTLSSVLTLGREIVSEYQVFDDVSIATAEFIDENSANDSLFLTGSQHLNPIASLAGRNIMCGSSSYIYYHGMNYSEQQTAVKAMYETPNATLLETWGVDYAYFSSYERNDFSANEAWYAENYPIFYENKDITIYKID